MKLSILIATQGRRCTQFKTLLKELMKQIKENGNQAEVIAYWNNGEHSIGHIRQALLEEAMGEYVCFIDDDDMIPEYYIKEILGALGKDYVGFRVQHFSDGVESKPVIHSLRYRVWDEDEEGFYRGVTHLNPLRREIALKGSFDVPNLGAGEDAAWARAVAYLPSDENFIDKVMYHYTHVTTDTSFGNTFTLPAGGYKRAKLHYKGFRYHPDSEGGI